MICYKFVPNVNVGAVPDRNWTLTFSISNKGSEAVQLNSITFDTFLCKSNGNAQNSETNLARPVEYALSAVVNETATPVATKTLPYSNCYEQWDENVTLTLNNVELAAGTSLTYKLTATNAQEGVLDKQGNLVYYGTFVGMKSATISTIPEPTTATLSLLALAGLAATRRRK